jgi:hypothetical protein
MSDQISKYDTRTGMVTCQPGASLYVRFHEEAHREQHQSKSAIWRIWWYGRWIRGVQWVVTLLIEYDAYRRARRALERLGAWTAELETEAWHGLKSYIKRKELS